MVKTLLYLKATNFKVVSPSQVDSHEGVSCEQGNDHAVKLKCGPLHFIILHKLYILCNFTFFCGLIC